MILESGHASGTHALEAESEGYSPVWCLRCRQRRLTASGSAAKTTLPRPHVTLSAGKAHTVTSQIIDLNAFQRSDSNWRGRSLRGQVIYESTSARSLRVKAPRRPPPANCLNSRRLESCTGESCWSRISPRRLNWGFDGVNLFAPTRLYGTPDDFRRFVDARRLLRTTSRWHPLDVVYNHFGLSGLLPAAGSARTSHRGTKTTWGDGINFNSSSAQPLREILRDERRILGSRIPPRRAATTRTQAIIDDSPEHILVEIGRRGAFRRTRSAKRSSRTRTRSSKRRWCGPLSRAVTASTDFWNDDFTTPAMVALTGRNEAYYRRPPRLAAGVHFVREIRLLVPGQRYSWQEQRARAAFDIGKPWQFVTFIQNHDQVANSARGLRALELTSPGRYRAMTAFFLLLPGTPMLFQGQEFAASAPFNYFADHNPELGKLVRNGRAEFMTQFRSLDRPDLAAWMPDPSDHTTFESCKLDFHNARGIHANTACTKTAPVATRRPGISAARLPMDRRRGSRPSRVRTSLFRRHTRRLERPLAPGELRTRLYLDQTPEPLLAPPEGRAWAVLVVVGISPITAATAHPPEAVDGWRIMGEAAIVLAPELLPPVDHEATQKAAKERAKEPQTPRTHSAFLNPERGT